MFNYEQYYTELAEKNKTETETETCRLNRIRFELEVVIIQDQIKVVFERIRRVPPLGWCDWIYFEDERRVSWRLLGHNENCRPFIVMLSDGRIAWERYYYDDSKNSLNILDLDVVFANLIKQEQPNICPGGYLSDMRKYIIRRGESLFDIPKDKISEWQEMFKKLEEQK